MNVIGYINSGYPEIRNIIDISGEYSYKKIRRYNSLLYFTKLIGFLGKVFPRLREVYSNRNYRFKYFPFVTPPGLKLIHSFNEVCYTRKKWVVTFETSLPRFNSTMRLHQGAHPSFENLYRDKEVREAVKRLASPNCAKIIALSSCSKIIQQDLLNNFPDFKKSVESKMIVLHPPQKMQINNIDEKRIDYKGKLNFLFVGSAFFRKGGMQMLQAFKKFEFDYDFNLTIISKMHLESFAAHETQEDIAEAQKFIAENSRWITYYESLTNEEVLIFMKKSHVGLLPTWADTYGFVTLEYQACGCPLISTDIRALPEINPEKAGWLIPVTKNKYGEALYLTKEDRERTSKEIIEGLTKILKEIFSDRTSIQLKAKECLKRINSQHNPDKYRRTLDSIYAS